MLPTTARATTFILDYGLLEGDHLYKRRCGGAQPMTRKENAIVECVRNNPPPVSTPNTWPAVLWEATKAPNLLITFAALLILSYLGFRIIGIDLLEYPLKQFGTQSPALLMAAPIDLSGDFEYRCSSSKDNTAWGGTARLSLTSTATGVVVSVSGERRWRGKKDKTGKIQKQFLDPSVPWNSIEGAFVSDRKIQWLYETHPEGVPVKGFSQLDLVAANGAVNRMRGRFADLAPGAQYGTLELRRTTVPPDSPW
jgi:hypothetical protein